jgi:UDP-N-acetylmuramoyl-tripeptide--D-alanyl-D-alanine ligase
VPRPIELRRIGLAIWHCRVALMYACAYVWRRMLFRTTFIAITGSVGKTTCKELTASLLGGWKPTAKSIANQNDYSGVPRSILRVCPWHRFAVMEVSTGRPGNMKRLASLVSPDVAVELAVQRNHLKEFRSLENIAKEKAVLLEYLRKNGVAILNVDDGRVAAMAESLTQRVVRVGGSTDCDYRADLETSRWPERYSFLLHAGAREFAATTRLIGIHWRPTALAALAVADVLGVPLEKAVAALGEVEPQAGRMQPVELPNGATMMRDEFDGSIDVLPTSLGAMRDATAARKILVISGIADSTRGPRDRYRRLGKEMFGIFDIAIFVGEFSDYGARGAIEAGMNQATVHAFTTVEETEQYLRGDLKAGDLVLLKGRGKDHLSRLVFSLTGEIRCRKVQCEKMIICDLCPELGATTPVVPALIAIQRTETLPPGRPTPEVRA